MRDLSLAIIVAILATSCTGAPAVPSAPSTPIARSFLSGTWVGTLTITRTGQAAVSGPTTWTFATIPDMPVQELSVTIQSSNPWLPVTASSTANVTPVDPPAQIGVTGTYASPRGCAGNFVTNGTATLTTIIGSFDGADCTDASGTPFIFTGQLSLTKQ
jgi:hypothetical protein